MRIGVLDVALECLQDMLLMPEGMTITNLEFDASSKQVRIYVQHETIPDVGPGDWYPRIELQFVRDSSDHVTLDKWTIAEGYPG